MLMLKAAGVRTVVASDLSPGRRDLARKCGADVVVDPRESSPWDAYKQRGPVRSLPDYMSYGIDAMSRVRAVPGLPWPRLLRVADRAGAAPAGPVVFECVGVPGKVDPSPLHTGTVGLDGVAAAFDDLRDPERHAKILVDPAR